VFLAFLLPLAACLRPFNEPTYKCNGDPNQRLFGIYSQGITTRELRRPQFFVCPANYTRDHLVELQVAKAYLLEDFRNSLSCKTVNWLNTRENVFCAPRELNLLKGSWFREVLEGRDNVCDVASVAFVTQVCMSGANVTCVKGAKCDGVPFEDLCCCHVTKDNAEAERNKTVFWKALTNLRAFEPEVRNDLLELQRFLSYKARTYCSGVKSTTTSAVSTSVPISGIHLGAFAAEPSSKKKKGRGGKSNKGAKSSKSHSAGRHGGKTGRAGFARGGGGHAGFARGGGGGHGGGRR